MSSVCAVAHRKRHAKGTNRQIPRPYMYSNTYIYTCILHLCDVDIYEMLTRTWWIDTHKYQGRIYIAIYMYKHVFCTYVMLTHNICTHALDGYTHKYQGCIYLAIHVYTYIWREYDMDIYDMRACTAISLHEFYIDWEKQRRTKRDRAGQQETARDSAWQCKTARDIKW